MVYEKEMEDRHSVRSYTDRRIEGDVLSKLQGKIESVNEESGLKIRLVLDEPSAFSRIMTKMTGFKNAVNYIAMIGPDDDELPIKAGYYGEDLVLYAQSLGLNTCWAMFCGKKGCEGLDKGDKFLIGIAVGYGNTQGVPHKNRPISDIADIDGAPEWFINGVKASMTAPTGMNAQKFRFEYDGDKVKATAGRSTIRQIDLGIAKFHFECGAGKDNFVWDD